MKNLEEVVSTLRSLEGLQARRGFTLIDALVAFIILLIAVIGLLAVLPFSFSNIETNADDVQAAAAAQKYMDALRGALAGAQPTPGPTTAPRTIGNSMAATSTVPLPSPAPFQLSHSDCAPPASGNPGGLLHDCIVTVTWSEQGVTKTIVLESYATNQL